MKKWLRASVALLALVAMLAENTYSVYAAMDGVSAEGEPVEVVEETPEQTIRVEAEEVEESASDVDEAVADEDTWNAADEETEEEEDTGRSAGVVSASIEAFDDRLEVEGVDDFTLYINTDQMNDEDTFTLDYTDDVTPFMDDVLFGRMTKEDGGIYNISELDSEFFELWVDRVSPGMEVEYEIREDDYPQITLISEPEPEVEKILEADGDTVYGEGYTELHISVNPSDLPDDTYYALYIDTDAEVKYDGETLDGNVIETISNRVEDIYLSNLDKQEFEIYVVGESTDEVGAEFFVESVENGALNMDLNMDGSARGARSGKVTNMTATAVNEDGEVISEDYTEMELPEFEEDVLALDDFENPPYEVSITNESGKKSFFEYVGAEVDGKEIIAVKRKEVTDQETGEEGYAYAYRTRDKKWVNCTEDTTINVIYRGNSKAVYTFEDNKVKIVVTLQDASDLPDNAILHADAITQESDPEQFASVGEQIESEIPEEKTLQEYCVYDVYFTVDDEEAEPANPVSVSIVYKEEVLAAEGEASAEDEIMAFHLAEDENGDVVKVENISEGTVTGAEGNVERLDFETDSFSPVVAARVGGADTFIGNGGSYSLYYVLNNLNYFLRNNAETNHTVGSVVVGGDATINTMGNANKAQSQKIPSYIKGLAKTGNIVTDQYIYLGTVNRGNSQTQVYGTKGIKYSDDYVDFDAAFNAFEAEMNSINCDIHITENEVSRRAPSSSHVKIENNYWRYNTVKLDAGHSYVFDSFNGVGIIDIQGSATAIADTVIKVNSSAAIADFPITWINGNYASSNENGIGCSLTFLFPSATKLNFGSNTFIGHIVAPKADVEIAGGNYNGCIVANSLKTNAEGHMWPYNGSIFTPSETGFEAEKLVDGHTPNANQKFTFILQEWKNNQWVQKGAAVENDGSRIVFPKISYGENDAGDHYYRVLEEEKAYNGYAIDTTQYIVKVTVTNTTSGNTTTQTATETYYQGTSIEDATNAHKVGEMTFNNASTTGINYDFPVKKLFYTNNGTNWTGRDDYTDYILRLFGTELGEDWPEGATFTFRLEPFDGDPAHAPVNAGVIPGDLPKATKVAGKNYCEITLDKDHRSGNFGAINFPYSQGGDLQLTSHYYKNDQGQTVSNWTWGYPIEVWNRTYMWKITEVIPQNKIPGVTYSTKTIHLKVFVDCMFNHQSGQYTMNIHDKISLSNRDGSCYDNPGPFEFVNKYVAGSLKVKKVAKKNNQLVDSDKDFHIVVYTTNGSAKTYYGTDGREYSSVHVETLKGNSELNFRPMPLGRQYYVEETDANGTKIESSTEYEITYSGLTNGSVQLKSKCKNKEVTITNTPIDKGILTLKKKGGLKTESPIDLSGVTFHLYKSDNTPIYVTGDNGSYTFSDMVTGKLDLVTDTNGSLKVEGLPIGTYYVQEVSLPESSQYSFIPYTEKITFEVTNSGTNLTGTYKKDGVTYVEKTGGSGAEIKLTVYNKRVPAKIKVKKQIISGRLSGSVVNPDPSGYKFYLYDETAKQSAGEAVTDANGDAVFSKVLTFGHTYTVTEDAEVAASKGTTLTNIVPATFTVDDTHWYSDVKADDVVEIGTVKYIIKGATATNQEASGKVKLLKVDESGKAIKEGTAQFVLSTSANADDESALVHVSGTAGAYKYDKESITTVMETVNGELTVDELKPGTYYFFEKASPDSQKYTFTNGDAHQFTIVPEQNAPVVELKVANSSFTAALSFEKVNAFFPDRKLTSGTEFTLYATKNGAIDGEAISTVSVNNGVVNVSFAKAGTYVLAETKTEKGYVSLYKDGQENPDILKIYLTVLPAHDKHDGTEHDGKTLAKLTLNDVSAYATQHGRVLSAAELVDTANNRVKNEPELGKVTLRKRFLNKDGQPIVTDPYLFLVGEARFKLYTNSDEVKKAQKKNNIIGNKERFIEYINPATNDGYFTTSSQTLTVENLPWGDYYFVEESTVKIDGKDVYVFNPKDQYIFTIGAGSSNADLQLDVTNFLYKKNGEGVGTLVETVDNRIKTGSVEIRKEDPDATGNKGIAGIYFDLYRVSVNENNEFTVVEQILPKTGAHFVTDSEGKIKVGDLEFGKYYFIESPATEQTVQGYQFDTTTRYFFDITEQGQTVSDLYYKVGSETKTSDGVIYNTPVKGQVTLDKWAVVRSLNGTETYEKLGGAKFELYVNKPLNGLQQFLSNFRGETYYRYNTYETNADGTITVTGLPWGNYYFLETEAPQGYVLPEKPEDRTYTFTIDGENLSAHIGRPEDGGNTDSYPVNERYNGALKLIKQEKGTNKNLSGVPFRLVKDGVDVTSMLDATNTNNKGFYTLRTGGDPVEVLLTDNNGTITVKELPWGTYHFEEVEVPEGFENIETSTKAMVINASNVSATATYTAENTATMFNTPIEGDLLLKKVDNEGNMLKGATFDLVRVENNEYHKVKVTTSAAGKYTYAGVESSDYRGSSIGKTISEILASLSGGKKGDLITDANAQLTVNKLPYGTYEIYEITPPDGFEPDKNEPVIIRSFTIDGKEEDGHDAIVTFVNTKIKAGVQFIKTAEGEELKGATFVLLKKDENGDYVLWNNVTATSAPGTYYKADDPDNTEIGRFNSVVTFSGLPVGEYRTYEISDYVFGPEAVNNYPYLDVNGKEIWSALTEGRKVYEFKIEASDSGKYNVGLDNEDGTLSSTAETVINTPKKGNAELLKREGTTAINGAKFALFAGKVDSNGNHVLGNPSSGKDAQIGAEVTSVDGKVSVSDLSWGHYYLVETQTSDNRYFLEKKIEDRAQYHFTIGPDANGKFVQTVTTFTALQKGKRAEEITVVQNEKIYGQAEFEKRDSVTGAQIVSKDVTFDLYMKKSENAEYEPVLEYAGENALHTAMPGQEGKIKTKKDLEVGSYYFIETSTAEGYDLPPMEERTKYYFEIKPKDDNNATVDDFEIVWSQGIATTSDGKVFVPNTPKPGSIELYKCFTLDGAKQPLGGATFKLEGRDTKGSRIDAVTGTSDENGKVKFTGLVWGTYEITEVTPPAGYRLPDGYTLPTGIVIDATHLDRTVDTDPALEIINELKPGSLKLEKVDKKGNAVAGVKFELQKKNETTGAWDQIKNPSDPDGYFVTGEGGLLSIFKLVDKKGTITVNGLEWGTYRFMEREVPEGFELLTEPIKDEHGKSEFVIGAGNTETTETLVYDLGKVVNNDVHGNIGLKKQDENKKGLGGAEFKLFQASATENFATTVYVKQTSEGVYAYVSMDAAKAAETEGYTDTLVSPASSDAGAGEILVTGLPYGIYYMKETKEPDPGTDANGNTILYQMDTRPIGPFNVTEDNVTRHIDWVNPSGEFEASVLFYKTDARDQGLNGVKYEITNKSNNNKSYVYSQQYGSESGLVRASFYATGKYTIQEIETPDNAYELDPNVYEFSILKENNGQTIDLSQTYGFTVPSGSFLTIRNGKSYFKNPDAKGKVKLYKKEVATIGGEPIRNLNGVTFELYQKVGENWTKVTKGEQDEFVTATVGTETGVITIDDLAWGEYKFVEVADKIPAGYEAVATEYPFTINEKTFATPEKIAVVTATNKQKPGSLLVQKFFEEPGDSVNFGSAAQFTLKMVEGTSDTGNGYERTVNVYKDQNDKNYYAKFEDLPWGIYTLSEVHTEEGYILYSGTRTIKIGNAKASENYDYQVQGLDVKLLGEQNPNAEVEDVTKGILNKKIKGSIELEKVDSVKKAPVVVSFKLYKGNHPETIGTTTTDKDPVVIAGKTDANGVFTTDANGHFAFEPKTLSYGSYYLEEQVPKGYEGYANGAFTYRGVNFKIESEETLHLTKANNKPIINTPETGSIELKKVDGKGKPIKGVKFTLYAEDAQGASALDLLTSALKSITTGENGTVYAELYTDAKGMIKITGLPWGTYHLTETLPAGYSITDEERAKFETPFYIGDNGTTKKLEYDLGVVKNTPLPGTVTLIKKGKDELKPGEGDPLAGAKFKLYKVKGVQDIKPGEPAEGDDPDDVIESNLESSADQENLGKVIVEGLEWGQYYFVEWQAPDGYLLDESTPALLTIGRESLTDYTDVSVEPDENFLNRETTLFNTKGYGYTALYKIFKMYNENSEELEGLDLSVEKDGTQLTFAIYRLDEDGNVTGDPVEASYGYYPDDSAALNKGTEFPVHAQNLMTDVIGPLPFGRYAFVEKSVPKDVDYQLDQEPRDFVISEKSTKDAVREEMNTQADARAFQFVTKFVNTTYRGWANICKTDMATGDFVAGVTFDVYEVSEEAGKVTLGAHYGSYDTKDNGVATVEGLPIGKYAFVEDAASAMSLGYIASDSAFVFDVTKETVDNNRRPEVREATKNEDGTYTLTDKLVDKVENERKTGSIRLIKTGKDGKKLAGATFNLWKIVGIRDAEPGVVSGSDAADEKITYQGTTDLVTDENGQIFVDELAWGSYYFDEIIPPKGYTLLARPNHDAKLISKESVNETAEVTMEDTPINVDIIKTDITGDEELEGAEMAIYAADNDTTPLFSWISKTTAQRIEIGQVSKDGSVFDGLMATVDPKNPVIYMLRENKAPLGYMVTTDIYFSVDAAGAVTLYNKSEDGKFTAATLENAEVITVTDNGAARKEALVKVKDNQTSVKITKRELGTTRYLKGAGLAIFDKDNYDRYISGDHSAEAIDRWTTKNTDEGQAHEITGKLQASNGTKHVYYLVETDVPAGYFEAAPIAFTVNNKNEINIEESKGDSTGEVTTDKKLLIMYDRPIFVEIVKRDKTKTEMLKGAVLNVSDPEKKVDVTFTTTEKPALLVPVSAEEAGEASVKAKYEKLAETYELIYGVKFNTKDTYTLKEVSAPKGYGLAADQTFSVDVKNAAYDKILGIYSTLMLDPPIVFLVSKRDLTGEKELAGASMAIYEKNGEYVGNKVVSWTSSTKEHQVSISDRDATEGVLECGKEYWLVEDAAPLGYALAEKIPFAIDAKGNVVAGEYAEMNGENVPRIIMKDSPLALRVSKEDADGRKLEGAKLELRTTSGQTGDVLASWVSDGKIAYISEHADLKTAGLSETTHTRIELNPGMHLRAGVTYYVVETEAPEGYEKAELPIEVQAVTLEEAKADQNLIKVKNSRGGTTSYDGYKTWNLRPDMLKELTEGDYKITINLYRYYENEGQKIYIGKHNKPVEKDDPDAIIDSRVLKASKQQQSYMFDNLDKYYYSEVNHGKAYEYIYDAEEDFSNLPENSIISKQVGTNFINIQRYTEIEGDKEWLLYKGDDGQALDIDNDETLKEKLELLGYKGDSAYVNVNIYLATLEKDGTPKMIDKDLDGEPDYYVTIKHGAIDTKKYGYVELHDLGKIVDARQKSTEHIEIIWTKPGEVHFAFKNLPAFDADYNEIKYAFVEERPESTNKWFTVEYNNDGKQYGTNGTLITNTPLFDPFTISGEKLWKDQYEGTADAFDKRPTVTIQLLQDGKEIRSQVLGKDYKFKFEGLYEFDFDQKKDGHRYIYELKEKESSDPNFPYAIDVDFNGKKFVLAGGELAQTATITNTIKPVYITIGGTKKWRNVDPTNVPQVTIRLYKISKDATGVERKEEINSYTMRNAADNKYLFTTDKNNQKLSKYDQDGKLITYKVEEDLTNLGDGYKSTPAEGYTITPEENRELYTGNDFENTPTSFRVRKTDMTSRRILPGATMRVVDASGKEYDRWVTNYEDHYVEGLRKGVYYLEEVEAPVGYRKIDPIRFELTDSSYLGASDPNPAEIVEDPPITGRVVLTKRDATTRDTLAGAVFNLFKSDGTPVRVTGTTGDYVYSEDGGASTSLTVNAAGRLEVNRLPYGTYYFREITAPLGHVLSTATERFTIYEQDATVEVTFLNERARGSVYLRKAGEDGSALAGAVFELYAATPRTPGQAAASTIYSDAYYRYDTYTTGADGMIYVTDLPWDDYYFIEVAAPDGYVTNTDVNGDPLVYTFSIDSTSASSVSVSLGTITNRRGGGGGGGGGGSTTTTFRTSSSSGVAGVRQKRPISDVLGVRAKPSSGVLGARVGPVTGDAANIVLWLLLLVASVSVIVVICIQNRKKKKQMMR